MGRARLGGVRRTASPTGYTLERFMSSVHDPKNTQASRSPLLECDRTAFRAWHDRIGEIATLAGPILESAAFERLGSITFLGILSPRFAANDRTLQLTPDGSRRSHSLGVALLNVDMARTLGFSASAQRYAAAWGLLHDIGNWPLSHTGEYAFARLTQRTTRELRRDIIVGAKAVPHRYALRRQVASSGLDVDAILGLLEHRVENLSGELRELGHLFRSPLVPDTFEGMWRCGGVIGVDVPQPQTLTRSFVRDETRSIRIRRGSEAMLLDFWRSKARIYDSFLNRADTVQQESAWAQAIMRDFADLTLARSLSLTEDEVVGRVLERGLPTDVRFSRYKAPVHYALNLRDGETLPLDATLDQVSAIFVGKRLDTGGQA